MKITLSKANESALENEIPVACLIELNGELIALTSNQIEKNNSTIYHAEVFAILEAQKKIDSKYLIGANVFVNLEPCPMCMGALILAKVKRIYFGAYDLKSGACGSVINLNSYKFNHNIEIYGGIMEEESSLLLKSFFNNLRNNSSQENYT